MLQNAVSGGNLELLEHLQLNHEQDLDFTDLDTHGNDLLHIAVESSKFDIAIWLLRTYPGCWKLKGKYAIVDIANKNGGIILLDYLYNNHRPEVDFSRIWKYCGKVTTLRGMQLNDMFMHVPHLDGGPDYNLLEDDEDYLELEENHCQLTEDDMLKIFVNC